MRNFRGNMERNFENKPFHLLVRFSNSIITPKDTIEEHKKIIEKYGSVWFGKMGKSLSLEKTEELGVQISRDIPSYIFLVKGNKYKLTFFKGKIKSFALSLPVSEMYLLPQYYSDFDIKKYVKFWVKINEIIPVQIEEFGKLKIKGSILSLRDTLLKSSSGHFYLYEK